MLNVSLLLWLPPLLVIVFLTIFIWGFWRNYRRPAKSLKASLKVLIDKTKAIKALPLSERQHALEQVLADSHLHNGWNEFKESLHQQFECRDGEMVLVRSRSTVPASFYFSHQTVVDTRLQTEYYKHLPGILTGLGIIGTFAGLLIGLSAFDASTPDKVQASVTLLLKAVRDAFYASAAAIAAAMFVTWQEKSLLRDNYTLLEELTEAIDQLFEAGVGEEYLAALVHNSEESAKQTRMLKDSLVNDLREMLQNLVDSQVRENLKLAQTLSASYQSAGDTMAQSISQSIESSFREPLDKIAASVQSASGDQSDKVGSLLQEVLVAFMNKLEGTFGQQFNGLQEMMGQSVTAMQQMQAGFSQLVTDMRAASESSSQAVQEQLSRTLHDMQQGQSAMQASMQQMLNELQQAVAGMGEQGVAAGARMAEQLEKLFEQSEARQRAMATELQSFVDAMKESVGKGQQDMVDGIAASVERMAGQLDGMLASFAQNRESMDQAVLEAQRQVQQSTQETVREMGDHVDHLLQTLKSERDAGAAQIKQIGEQTEKALSGMKDGAERMRLAAERFEAAGKGAVSLSQTNSDAAQKIGASCDALSLASKELAGQIAEYRTQRDAVQKMLSSLESMMANNKIEADARQKLAQDYRMLTEKIQLCNNETATYLQRINDVLTNSFNSFGSSMESNVRKSMANMESEIDKAISYLATGVTTLGDNIEELSDVVGKAVAKRN